jgi:hypothetical protein
MPTPELPADPHDESTQRESTQREPTHDSPVHGEPVRDAVVRDAILQWPTSATPRTLEQKVRQRVRQRRRTRQQTLVGFSFGILCLAGFLAWQPWRESPPKQITRTDRETPRDTPMETSPPKLAASDLQALFGLPPVEDLTVLDRRQSIAFEAMQQWEGRR